MAKRRFSITESEGKMIIEALKESEGYQINYLHDWNSELSWNEREKLEEKLVKTQELINKLETYKWDK